MPTYTLSGALLPSDDNGFIPTDGVTSVATPRLSGLAPAGAVVNLNIAGDNYSAVADVSGRWLVALAATTPDGTYAPSATAVLNGASIGAFNVRSFTLDRTAPIQIDNAHLIIDGTEGHDPGTSAIVTTNTQPAFTGRVASGTLVLLTIYGVDINGQSLDRQYSQLSTGDAWSIAVPESEELPDGLYEVTFSFLDKAGNTLTVQGTPLVIDNQVPGESIAQLLDVVGQDTGLDAHDGITNQVSPTFFGTTEPFLNVLVEVDTQSQSVQADANGRWEATFTNLPDGEYVPLVTVTDLVGNAGDGADGQTIVVDTLTPENISSTLTDDESIDTGALSTDGITSNRTPELTGETEPYSQVSITVNAQTYTTVADDAGAWALTLTNPLPDGTYTPSISIIDPAGNQAVYTNYAFTIDGTAPDGTGVASSLVSDADNDSGISSSDHITHITSPLLTGTAPANAVLLVEVDGGEYEVTADEQGQWQVQLDDLSDGVYQPLVYVIDVAGNVSEPFEGQAFTIDTTAPEELEANLSADDITGTSEDYVATNHTRPTLVGTTEAFATLEVEVNAYVVQTQADEFGHWQVTAPENLPDGQYVVRVASTDVAGNRSEWMELDPIVIDTVVSLAIGGLMHDSDNDTGTSDTDNLTNNALPVLRGYAEAGSTVDLAVSDQSYQTIADDEGYWEVSLESELSDGKHVAQIKVTDLAGNVGNFQLDEFTIDTQAVPIGLIGTHVATKVGAAIDIDARAMVGMTGLVALVEDYGNNLADGLTIDPSTGHIVGAATTAGSTWIGVTTSDAAGNEGTSYFQVNAYAAEWSGNKTIRTTDSERAVKSVGTEVANRLNIYSSDGDFIATGGGDDEIKIINSDGMYFGRIDGGNGLDKLAFGFGHETIDFADFNNAESTGQVLKHVEWFDVIGKQNTIHITADDLFRMSSDKFDVDGVHRMVNMTTYVNNSNSVDLEGFTQIGASNAFNADGSLSTKRTGDKFSKFTATVHDATGDHLVELLLEKGFLTT